MISTIRAWVTVAFFSALFIMSFVDRLILALMVDPIRADLGVSDFQISLLIGTSFAFFYSLSGLPIARIADTGNRRRLIMVGALIWGVSTSAAAFSGNFTTLLILRMGVALGEAALTPAVMSIIGDLFPPNKRALPASIYTMIGVSGGSAAMLIGGFVLDLVSGGAMSLLPEAMHDVAPWRLTLFLVGLPAIVLALLVPLVVPDPPRTDPVAEKTGPRDVVHHLRANAVTYAGFLGGTALLAMVNYSVLAWYATYLIRRFDMPASEAGYLFGVTGMFASIAGGLLLSFFSEWLLRRGHYDAPFKVALGALVVATPLLTLSLLAPDKWTAIALAAVSLFFLLGLGILLAAMATILAPGRIRAQMVALYHVILSLVGFGIGPPLVAMLSRLFFNDQGIGPALAMMVLAFGALQVGLLVWSRKAFAHSFEAAHKPLA